MITSHQINDFNKQISIDVLDEGGCVYGVCIADPEKDDEVEQIVIQFQQGLPSENGYNGLSNEVLLAIVEDRLKRFQAGPLSSRENSLALTKLQECMMWLEFRAKDRTTRGVEATNQK